MSDLSEFQSGDIVWFVKPGNLTPYKVTFGKIMQNKGNKRASIFMNVGCDKDKKTIVELSKIFNTQLEAEVFAAIELEKYISNLKNDFEAETFKETIFFARNTLTKCENEFPDVVLKIMMSS